MAMAFTLQKYLDRKGVNYELFQHPYTSSCMQSAEVAHIHGDQIAKGVVLGDDIGYLMAVVPATHHVQLGKLHNTLDRYLGLVTEQELADLFKDCDVGAIPPLGDAYGMPVVMDESLTACPDIYFEAGDHEDLVHVSGEDFKALMSSAGKGLFSQHI